MKKVSVFVTLILSVLLLITFGSVSGMTVLNQTQGANVAISSIGVILAGFIMLCVVRRRIARKVMDASVWKELELAEEEWEKRK